MSSRIRQVLPVAGTIVAASVVAALIIGVLTAIWVLIAMFSQPGAKQPAFSDVSAIGASFAVLFVILSAYITLPLCVLTALAAHLCWRYFGIPPSILLPTGGFVVGSLVWLVMVLEEGGRSHPVSLVWSAPVVGGLGGFVAGRILARLWTRPSS